MKKHILVLGATGMLGQPVTRQLVANGHRVRILVRNFGKALRMFEDTVEIIEGSVQDRVDLWAAMENCNAVHINLGQEAELETMRYVTTLAPEHHLERITYVSATTVCEENRWFELVDIKMHAEEILRQSGFPYTIFCPTWVMETLNNFVHGNRVVIMIGKNPPKLHFFAGEDFGRIVAASYDDDRALGKRLFIHGPEGIILPDAIERFAKTCHPDCRIMRLKLWQAKLIAKLTGRKPLAYATHLIDYFDKVGELGDPTEADTLFGAPSITLDEWFETPKESEKGIPD